MGAYTLRPQPAGWVPVTPVTPPAHDPVGQSPGVWTLQAWDDFDGPMTTIDATNGLVKFGGKKRDGSDLIWRGWYPPSPDMLSQSPAGNRCTSPGYAVEYYDLSALSVASSILSLTATYATTPYSPTLTYIAGMIQCNDSFNPVYGYAEARIACPAAQGSWPAFWLPASDWSWPPEIDVFEMLNDDTSQFQITTWNIAGATQGNLSADAHAATMTDFNVFGLRWTPSDLTFYLNGTQVAQDTNTADIPNQGMYLVVDTAIRPTNNPADYPSVVQVDYVRFWQ